MSLKNFHWAKGNSLSEKRNFSKNRIKNKFKEEVKLFYLASFKLLKGNIKKINECVDLSSFERYELYNDQKEAYLGNFDLMAEFYNVGLVQHSGLRSIIFKSVCDFIRQFAKKNETFSITRSPLQEIFLEQIIRIFKRSGSKISEMNKAHNPKGLDAKESVSQMISHLYYFVSSKALVKVLNLE